MYIYICIWQKHSHKYSYAIQYVYICVCDNGEANRWKRGWMPKTGSRAGMILAHWIHYHDSLLRDMGEPHRLRSSKSIGIRTLRITYHISETCHISVAWMNFDDRLSGLTHHISRICHVCVTHSYPGHQKFMCVTWNIHSWDVTHSRVWEDLFICVSRSCVWCGLFMCVPTRSVIMNWL